jgi:hypothetical protein
MILGIAIQNNWIKIYSRLVKISMSIINEKEFNIKVIEVSKNN